MELTLKKELSGRILDIGGGGEGIVGRLYGNQVTAIDIDPRELSEAPDGFEKVVMDATALTYPAETFDVVTAFYAMMFFPADQQAGAFREAARVLRPGGLLCIWDCQFDSAWPEPFLTDLTICLPDQRVRTTYGVGKQDGQTMEDFLRLGRDHGLIRTHSSQQDNHFFLRFQKE